MRDWNENKTYKGKRSGLGMENKNIETEFKYAYSAKEQDEIKRIRQKYQEQEEDEMSRLRRLDAKVYQKATTNALVFGVLGALVMGSGMSLVLTDLGVVLGLGDFIILIIGIVVGIIGMFLMALAYPVYIKVLKKERERIAPEILKLTEELLR